MNYTQYNLSHIIDDAEKRFGGDFSAKLFVQQLLMCGQCERYQVYFIDQTVTHEQLIQYFEGIVGEYLDEVSA